MVKDNFYALFENKDADAGELKELSKLLIEYPYFSLGHMLQAKLLKNKNHSGFSKTLSAASSRVSNRKQLYLFINETRKLVINETKVSDDIDETIIDDKAEFEEQIPETVTLEQEKPVFKVPEKDIIQQILSYPEIKKEPKAKEEKQEAEIVKEVEAKKTFIETPEKQSFTSWLNGLKNKPSNVFEIQKPIDKKELIERFIRADPKISAPTKKEFFSPAIMAKKSMEDHDDIVTETLAQIHVNQGNIPKAIKIYEKLLLIYPEKSSYFAALIKKLESE
jgi:hypothetical protein